MQFRALPEIAGSKASVRELDVGSAHKETSKLSWPIVRARPRLQQIAKSGHAIFVALNDFDGNGRKKENLVAALVIPLDLDGASFPMIGRSNRTGSKEMSPGRYQCFFVIERTTDIAAVEDIARRLASNYGGDPAVFDATHVFRMPGFYHQKLSHFALIHFWKTSLNRHANFRTSNFCPRFRNGYSDTTTVGVGTLDPDKAELLFGDDGALDPTKFDTNDKWI